jgi:hypothetical protein
MARLLGQLKTSWTAALTVCELTITLLSLVHTTVRHMCYPRHVLGRSSSHSVASSMLASAARQG